MLSALLMRQHCPGKYENYLKKSISYFWHATC